MTWIRSLTPRERAVAALGAVIVSILAVTAAAVTGGDGDASLATSGSSTTLGSPTSSSSSTTSPSSTSSSSSSTSSTVVAPPAGSATTMRSGGGTPTTKAPTTTRPPAPPTSAPTAGCNTSSSGAPGQLSAKFCSYRAANGLATMTRTAALDAVAQEWANKLAADHDANPSEFDLPHRPDQQARVLAACDRCNGWAENVGYATTADGVWDAWLASSSHLANIRNPRAGEFGMGVARSDDGYLFAVQNFGRYP